MDGWIDRTSVSSSSSFSVFPFFFLSPLETCNGLPPQRNADALTTLLFPLSFLPFGWAPYSYSTRCNYPVLFHIEPASHAMHDSPPSIHASFLPPFDPSKNGNAPRCATAVEEDFLQSGPHPTPSVSENIRPLNTRSQEIATHEHNHYSYCRLNWYFCTNSIHLPTVPIRIRCRGRRRRGCSYRWTVRRVRMLMRMLMRMRMRMGMWMRMRVSVGMMLLRMLLMGMHPVRSVLRLSLSLSLSLSLRLSLGLGRSSRSGRGFDRPSIVHLDVIRSRGSSGEIVNPLSSGNAMRGR